MSFRVFITAVNPVLRLNLRNSAIQRPLVQYFCTESTNENEAQKKKKTTIIPKITLITNENVSITTLEEATKLSKRRDLKLVKIVDVDSKTQRPVYKLMTGAEFLQEDLKQREIRKKERAESTIKGEKVVILSAGISEHDLMVYVNKISKWIAKRYEVRFVINSNNNMEKAEKIYSFLENNLKDNVRILQKRVKGSEMKFQMMPPKKDKEHKDNS